MTAVALGDLIEVIDTWRSDTWLPAVVTAVDGAIFSARSQTDQHVSWTLSTQGAGTAWRRVAPKPEPTQPLRVLTLVRLPMRPTVESILDLAASWGNDVADVRLWRGPDGQVRGSLIVSEEFRPPQRTA